MTRDKAILVLLGRLGQRQNDTVLQAAAVDEMNFAQERLERDKFKPWFLLSELRSISCVANEERLQLPADFLEEPEEGALWRKATTGGTPRSELRKDSYDIARARYPLTGMPVRYSITGQYFRLHPTPDAVYDFECQFYVAQPQIAEAYGAPGLTTTNAWLTYAPNWLMAETGLTLATLYTRDMEAAQVFKAMREEARNACYVETVQRMEANASRQMGED